MVHLYYSTNLPMYRTKNNNTYHTQKPPKMLMGGGCDGTHFMIKKGSKLLPYCLLKPRSICQWDGVILKLVQRKPTDVVVVRVPKQNRQLGNSRFTANVLTNINKGSAKILCNFLDHHNRLIQSQLFLRSSAGDSRRKVVKVHNRRGLGLPEGWDLSPHLVETNIIQIREIWGFRVTLLKVVWCSP